MTKIITVDGHEHMLIKTKKGWVRSKTQWTVEYLVDLARKSCESTNLLVDQNLEALFNIEIAGG